MKILIVDDDEIGLELLRHTLNSECHEVHSAPDGQKALELLKREQFGVVITDWEMPELDGLSLCRAIRANSFSGYTYIVLLTGRSTMAERIQGFSAGADDFISKPFEPAEILARLQTADRILSMETRDVAIFAMARLAESRDPDTIGHLERVMHYSRILAQQLPAIGKFTEEIDAEYIRLVYSTSPLHDIGKVGVPDAVLLKPGRLSDEEFEIMKEHTTIGANTLDAAAKQFPKTKFLQMARDIAATHHERFDGTGYPAKLKGDAIPLCGRIVALADVYDALTSKRVYKEAYTHAIAKNIITKEAGTHFSPEMVEAFIASEKAFVAITQQFRADLARA